ncbi:MAG: hypothetical protein HRT68_15880, partial [Flavobacteriaceae bacterium]|nr:hypothetical protein [Flavobacteriaceae bacterium]
SSDDIKIVGYKVKDFVYFNKTYSISESRLIALCPVIKIDHKEIDLFWLFYPDIRNSLSQSPFKANKKLSSMEDVFHKRYFNSFIYEIERIGEDPSSINVFDPKTISHLKNFSIIQEVHHLYMEWYLIQSEKQIIDN